MEYRGYKIYTDKNDVKVYGVNDFDPVHTFECGQCFRWRREADGSYTVIAGSNAANISYLDGILKLKNTSIERFKEFWFDYFDLERDYSWIKRQIVKDEIMEEAVKFGNGIRILKQDLFETLISFIISSNNRIPMIMKVVASICRNYGNEIEYNGEKFNAFPEAMRLASTSLEELSGCKGGFRCKYIRTASEMVAKGEIDLTSLKGVDIDSCRNLLMKIPGVGRKVADCTILYSGTRYDVFPTDVWVKRVMEELYFKKEASFKEIHSFAVSKFGDLSGFAQQYLFYYARENRIGTGNKGQ
jgi:N-glycosylase/DNA lyase